MIAGGIASFPECVDATVRAKPVLARVRVERVGTELIVRSEQAKAVSGNWPK